MKNFKKLSLVAGFATLMSFGAEAQVASKAFDLFSISSTNSGFEGGELQLNDPLVLNSTPTFWVIDNYKSNLRFFKPQNSTDDTYIDFMGNLKIMKNKLTTTYPFSALSNTLQSSSGLIIESNTFRSEGNGASLGFTLNAGNTGTGWENGRILVTPDKFSVFPVNAAYGKMYLQTRGPVVNGQWTWNKNLVLDSDGSVAIGCETSPNYKLTVDGKMTCRGIKVQDPIGNTLWPDYVFKQDYKLRTLAEVEHFITANNHLPDVPSELEVKTDGIELATMDAVLLRKVEELTLYMIQLQKDNLEMKAKLEALSK